MRGSCAAAVGLSPACSLAAHSPAGMNAWMNAKAGEAIMTISSDAVTTAASPFFTLPKTEPPSSSLPLVRFPSLLLPWRSDCSNTSFPQSKTDYRFHSSRLHHWLCLSLVPHYIGIGFLASTCLYKQTP
jgi:hypothetical protein